MKTKLNELKGLVAWAAAQDALKKMGLKSTWDQMHWYVHWDNNICGSPHCIGGEYMLRHGWEYSESTWIKGVNSGGTLKRPVKEIPVDMTGYYVSNKLGLKVPYGATYYQGNYHPIFKWSNTVEDMIGWVNDIESSI